MNRPASTLTSYAVAIARAIDSYGIDSSTLFSQAALDVQAMRNPNARYPDSVLAGLVRQVVLTTRDHAFGLRIARYIEPTTLHALGFSLLASQSLYSALLRLARYHPIVSDGITLRFAALADGYLLSLEAAEADSSFELCEALLAGIVGFCRRLHRGDFSPRQVSLRRPRPDDVTPFADFFKAPIAFDAVEDTLLFDQATIEAELPTGNAELAYQNDKIVADYLARFDPGRLSERVRTLFIDRLPTGKFSEDQIAEELQISLRSLQRRLRDEQTSYQQLLDETRLDLALQYINRSRLSVAQIAELLGFSDSSNFNRAFKRWLGISPQKYRALGFA
ncbi:MAG: AraC family transcriptional regulator [Gammaproteobacteria bacterium]